MTSAGAYTPLATATATAVVSHEGEDSILNPYSTSSTSNSPGFPPEAQNRVWDDTFFDGEDNGEVIAVFDFDYATIEDFNTKVGFASLAAFGLYPPLLGLALLGCAPCFLRRNVEWSARSKHVALTRDGIRFVRDRRPTCWGLSMCDAGRSSKTVPYDQITDCDVEEPAGNTCLCIANVLSTVNIDTASSGGQAGKELKIVGLKDPVGFKKLVWAMKRFNAIGGLGRGTHGGVVANSMHRGGAKGDAFTPAAASSGAGGQESESIAFLLREIRDELRELRKAKGGEDAVQSATEVVDMVTTAAETAAADEATNHHNIV
mmetsp:Transcript_35256/g.71414  ORF Transcript_35256/g.71414 Transcript_35256/m.71414 type:complete len:318 (-) Transcript_35256:1387-2340(-)